MMRGTWFAIICGLACLMPCQSHGKGLLQRAGDSVPPPPCVDPIPAAASTWGYTSEVFCANNVSRLDVHNTGLAGFLFYTRFAWSGLASGNTGWQSNSPAQASWFTPALGGGFQILPTGTSNFGATLTSCITNGNAGQWIGSTFSGGMYVKIAFGSVPTGNATPDGNWPVFWLWPTEFTAALSPGPAAGFIEVDIIESAVIDGSETSKIIGWNGNGSAHTFTDPFQKDQSTTGGTHTNQSYEMLLVSPAQNGGTGFIDAYFNDALNPNSPTPHTKTFLATDPENAILTQHNCINITTGSGQPMVVRSVQVWQAPASSCASNFTYDASNGCGALAFIMR